MAIDSERTLVDDIRDGIQRAIAEEVNRAVEEAVKAAEKAVYEKVRAKVDTIVLELFSNYNVSMGHNELVIRVRKELKHGQ